MKKIYILLFSYFVFSCISATAQAAAIAQERITVPGVKFNDVYVEGNYAYVAADSWGIYCYDTTTGNLVSRLANPLLPNGKGDYTSSRELLLKDNVLIVASREYGTRFIDVSNPANPYVITTIPNIGKGKSSRLEISGNTLYVGGFLDGLVTIDVTDIRNPAQLGQLTFKNQYGVTIEAQGISTVGNLAYVATPWAGWSVVDVSDPTQPALVTSMPIPARGATGWDVEVRNNHAFVLFQNYGLQIYDVTDSHNISLLSESYTGGASDYGADAPPADIKFLNDTIAFMTHGREVLVYDFSDILNPVILERIAIAADGDRLYAAVNTFIKDSILYVASYLGGLQMFDISGYINTTATPIPGALVLLLSGLCMLFGIRRKTRAVAA